jgi:hypothetical protein
MFLDADILERRLRQLEPLVRYVLWEASEVAV